MFFQTRFLLGIKCWTTVSESSLKSHLHRNSWQSISLNIQNTVHKRHPTLSKAPRVTVVANTYHTIYIFISKTGSKLSAAGKIKNFTSLFLISISQYDSNFNTNLLKKGLNFLVIKKPLAILIPNTAFSNYFFGLFLISPVVSPKMLYKAMT